MNACISRKIWKAVSYITYRYVYLCMYFYIVDITPSHVQFSFIRGRMAP